ncbi:MAG TPA: hypothetical protein VJK30_06545 [Coxiellaceae bacterium]|nr:MAG: hypothetical protein A3E81_05665 [Gammaproteobacteria bacterium RIFCSPHIGHO2_12_FULL_36_30]HLB56967.1 hypothetical protein [Coxiellaceae bacterium]
MRNLPLFYYPGTWIYVDDDKTLLGCMSLAFDENAHSKTFSSPNRCVEFLNHYQSPSSQQHFLQCNNNDESHGILQHTPIDFDITKIANFADEKHRYEEITAMLIDYHMPEMNGFSLSQACGHLPVNKILLTGKTEDEKVINGFNQNYIQRYIQKGSDNLEENVIKQLKELSFGYFQKITAPLLAYLEVENLLPLSDPIFIDFFLNFCQQNNIREYYLIDKQGSFLCIDADDKKSYFVMQTDRSLETWLSIYYTGTEFSPDFAEKIQDRDIIPFFGQGKEAWQIEQYEWFKHFHYVKGIIAGREKYYWIYITDEEYKKKHG